MFCRGANTFTSTVQYLQRYLNILTHLHTSSKTVISREPECRTDIRHPETAANRILSRSRHQLHHIAQAGMCVTSGYMNIHAPLTKPAEASQRCSLSAEVCGQQVAADRPGHRLGTLTLPTSCPISLRRAPVPRALSDWRPAKCHPPSKGWKSAGGRVFAVLSVRGCLCGVGCVNLRTERELREKK